VLPAEKWLDPGIFVKLSEDRMGLIYRDRANTKKVDKDDTNLPTKRAWYALQHQGMLTQRDAANYQIKPRKLLRFDRTPSLCPELCFAVRSLGALYLAISVFLRSLSFGFCSYLPVAAATRPPVPLSSVYHGGSNRASADGLAEDVISTAEDRCFSLIEGCKKMLATPKTGLAGLTKPSIPSSSGLKVMTAGPVCYLHLPLFQPP